MKIEIDLSGDPRDVTTCLKDALEKLEALRTLGIWSPTAVLRDLIERIETAVAAARKP